jgi:hypothetical protein
MSAASAPTAIITNTTTITITTTGMTITTAARITAITPANRTEPWADARSSISL